MAKSHAQRQKEYLKRLKEKGEADCLKKKEWKQKGRARKQKGRAVLKLNKQKHALVKVKNRQRKKN